MPCYKPIEGFRSRFKTEKGKRQIVFDPREGYPDLPVTIPCGQCTGCRLERSRQWAIRCMHEASMYDNNCFVTLTYNNENLPKDNTLVKKDFQLFMKRLRKKFPFKPIKYYQCGEYGDENSRPHYHACLFNFDFNDKTFWKNTDTGEKLYRSRNLEALWPQGYSSIGEVTFESAAYVARYVMKKITGERAPSHYLRINYETGELYYLQEEYTTMSRRPGIGTTWLEKYKHEVLANDSIIMRGIEMKPPRFYDQIFEEQFEKELLNNKKERKRKSLKHKEDNTPERLATREKVKQAQLTMLKRNLKHED